MKRPPPAVGRLSQAPAASFRWVDSEPQVCAMGLRENLTLIVWWTQATAPAVERVAKLTRDVCAEHRRFSNIHVIQDGALAPTPAARAGFIQMIKDCAGQLSNAAVVVGGSGFWAGMMRSAVTGMRFVTPRTFELRLHSEPQEILAWLPQAHLSRCGSELSHASLAEILTQATHVLTTGVVELQPVSAPAMLLSQPQALVERKRKA